MKVIQTNETNLDIKVTDLTARVTKIEALLGTMGDTGDSIDARITKLELESKNININITDIEKTEIDITKEITAL